MLITGTTCNDLPTALDLGGGVLSFPADQGRALMGVEGAKPPEALEILQFTLAKKFQKYTRGPFTINYNFVNFVE